MTFSQLQLEILIKMIMNEVFSGLLGHCISKQVALWLT